MKVLIVDDESLGRVLIRNSFEWEQNGFEIVGEAAGSYEALEIAQSKEPDIIITDINMPYMDGLELSKKIKKEYPNCRVIIVTGYRDFDYATRAIKLGVKDFILKPIVIKDMYDTMTKIKEEILNERQKNLEYTKLKNFNLENKNLLKDAFLQRLAEGRVNYEEGIYKLNLYDINFLIDKCMCIQIKVRELSPNQIKQSVETISNLNCNIVCFIHFMGNIVIFLDKPCDIDFIYKLKDIISSQIIIGIGKQQTGFDGILKSYQQSKQALDIAIITNKDLYLFYEDIEKLQLSKNKKETFDLENLIFSIENGLQQKACAYIDKYTEDIKNTGSFDCDYIKIMTVQMVFLINTLANKNRIRDLKFYEESEQIYKQISDLNTLEQMNLFLKQMINQIIENNQNKRFKKPNKLVEQTLKYIDDNFQSIDLSLKTIAKQLYVNDSYLSRIFKQQKGECITEYITKKRIEKSIFLLNTTDLKVYEIADKVGIADPHYFSICFKKYVGKTIKEFKNQNSV